MVTALRIRGLAILILSATSFGAHAGGWNYWGNVFINSGNTFPGGAQLATDGANLYYSTSVQGVYAAPLDSPSFYSLPMTGFPLWDANTNTNGFAVSDIAVSAQGTLVISGTPINIISNTLGPAAAAFTNTLPVFYWWDAPNQLWQPAAVSNKSYPYTATVGNFTVAADGSLWTCSGYAPYAYRSTDGGKSFTAFDIDASVPANYFPIPFTGGEMSFGRIFSIAAGWNGQIVIGTETGGFLFTTNNGQNWASLDPCFANTNSANPLGRVNNAAVAGLDHHGYFLCDNFEMPDCPAKAAWGGVSLIGYRPRDDSYFDAANGLNAGFTPASVLTTESSGVSFAYMNQNYLLQGGVFDSLDGADWFQFNQGNTLDEPFPPGVTNVEIQGGCITTLSNLAFIGVGPSIYVCDSTPLPITNRPPVALPQNINLVQHSSVNFTLAGSDADGDPLDFTVTMPTANGTLSGTPPNLSYIAPRRFTGFDSLQFVVDDGMATSAPVYVNFAVNSATSQPPVISFTAIGNQGWLVEPTNIVLSANATAAYGVQQVNFYNGTNLIGTMQNPPYNFTWTNTPPGDYVLSACAIDTAQAATWAPPARVLVLPDPPILQISRADASDFAVSWPASLDGFFVESSTNAAGPWILSPWPQFFSTNTQTATIPSTQCRQFFRLQRPRRGTRKKRKKAE